MTYPPRFKDRPFRGATVLLPNEKRAELALEVKPPEPPDPPDDPIDALLARLEPKILRVFARFRIAEADEEDLLLESLLRLYRRPGCQFSEFEKLLLPELRVSCRDFWRARGRTAPPRLH